MPKPTVGESQKDFISRCIPIVMKEGTAKDGEQAAAICHSLWEKRGGEANLSTEPIYLLDNFMSTTPGEPFRLFPFGSFFKGGKHFTITPERAASFKLPHFKPPIKLGSHDEETPAGGHIIGLEVRDDGLYAIPELVPAGEKAMKEGAYRYHSPEVIWEDGAYEDPRTGGLISGPLIIGDALLHTPHLGDAAALYGIEVTSLERSTTMAETIQVPVTLWDKFMARVFPEAPPAPAPDPEPKPLVVPEEFVAAKKELDELKAAEVKRASVAKFAAEFVGKEAEAFGAAYIELGKSQEAAEMLAGMTPEQSAWCLRNFKAFSKQIKESALIGEVGSSASTEASGDLRAAFDAAVKARMAKDKVEYLAAYNLIKTEQPDTFAAAFGAKKE